MRRCDLVWGLAVLALVAGCAAQPATTSSAARPLSGAEDAFLWQAEEALVSRCMAEQGFRYVVERRSTGQPRCTFPYGNDDVGWARRHGFGSASAAAADAEQPVGPNDEYVRRLSAERQAAYVSALNGDPRRYVSAGLPNGMRVMATVDGCTAAVRRELYGEPREWLVASYTVQAIGGEAHRRVTADPRYLSVLDRWRACMAARGHRYASPGAAADELARSAGAQPGPASRADEIRVAVASADCAKDSRLVAVATRLDEQHRQRVGAEWQRSVVSYHQRRAAALARARQLLGDQPLPE